MDLSIAVTGIRTAHWDTLFASIKYGLKKYSYEVIFIGPIEPSKELLKNKNVKFLKDRGTPSRCTQISSLISEGSLFTFLADDAIIYENSLDESVDLLVSKNPAKDLIAIRHIQTQNYDGITPSFSQRNKEWWMAHTHPILRQPFVKKEWLITCNPLMSLTNYIRLGGLDCRFVHVNYNVHDLSFRAQKDECNVFISPSIVMNTPIHNERPSSHPLMIASTNIDEPLFKKLWSEEDRNIQIDIDNWKLSSQDSWS